MAVQIVSIVYMVVDIVYIVSRMISIVYIVVQISSIVYGFKYCIYTGCLKTIVRRLIKY